MSSLPTPARTDWQRVWVSGFLAGGDVRVCLEEVSGTFHEDQATLPRLVVSKAHYPHVVCGLFPRESSRTPVSSADSSAFQID